MSYPEQFAVEYDPWAAGMTKDVPFDVELAKEADGPVVELAVGTGRVAIPVARAIGRTVIGVDSSPAMLEQARGLGEGRRVAASLLPDGRFAWNAFVFDHAIASRLDGERHDLIDISGLEVEALYGWFDRRPFDDESREFVWIARKPG
jgi:methyltransferase family protein